MIHNIHAKDPKAVPAILQKLMSALIQNLLASKHEVNDLKFRSEMQMEGNHMFAFEFKGAFVTAQYLSKSNNGEIFVDLYKDKGSYEYNCRAAFGESSKVLDPEWLTPPHYGFMNMNDHAVQLPQLDVIVTLIANFLTKEEIPDDVQIYVSLAELAPHLNKPVTE